MIIRRLLAALTLAASVSALAACSGGTANSGFVPAAPQTASATRTAKDEVNPHP